MKNPRKASFVDRCADALLAYRRPLLVLFLLIVIAVAGSGRLSLDHVLLQKKQEAPAHA